MRDHIFVFGCLCSVIVIINAVPLPANNQELDVLQIPLTNGKELDVLTIGAKDQEEIIAERNKRTIGLLRELFPDLTKQVDDQVNRIISKLLRTLGPTVLRTAIQGNSATATATRTDFDADFDDDDNDSNSDSTKVSVELPTFEPEDNEIDTEDTKKIETTTTATATVTSTVSDMLDTTPGFSI